MMNPLYRKMFRDPMAGRKPQGILASSVPMMTAAQKAMAQNQPVKAQTGTSVNLTQNPAIQKRIQDQQILKNAMNMVQKDTDFTYIDTIPDSSGGGLDESLAPIVVNRPEIMDEVRPGGIEARPPTAAEILAKQSQASGINMLQPFDAGEAEMEKIISAYETDAKSSDKDRIAALAKEVYGEREPLKTEEENVEESVALMKKYLGDIDPRAKEKNLYMALMRAGFEYASGKNLGEAGGAALDQFGAGAKEIAAEEKGLIRAGVQLGLEKTEAAKLRDQALNDARFNAEFNYLLAQDQAERDATKTAFNARYGFITNRITTEADQIKFARGLASQEKQLIAQLTQQQQIATDDRLSADARTNAQIEAARTNAVLSNLDAGASIAFEAGWTKGLRGDALNDHMLTNAPALSALLDDQYLKDYSPSRLKTIAMNAIVDLDANNPGMYINQNTGNLTDAGAAILAQYMGGETPGTGEKPGTLPITADIKDQLDTANYGEGDLVTIGGATYIISGGTLVPQEPDELLTDE